MEAGYKSPKQLFAEKKAAADAVKDLRLVSPEEADELRAEIVRLKKLLRETANLLWATADDESGIDENETYKAAIAASER
jgi:DNA-directed RNA polymerase subunit F